MTAAHPGFFGHRLRQERLLAGLERAEMAAVLGVSLRTLRDYEAGGRRIPGEQLVKAMGLFGITLAQFCYDGYTAPADPACAGKDGGRWISVARPSKVLWSPAFARIHPLLKLWEATRGELPLDFDTVIARSKLAPRSYLLRVLPRSSRLIIESHAYGVAYVRPCEAVQMIGHQFHELYDQDYGAWIEEAYCEAASARELRVQLARAIIHTAAGSTVHTRYDRILIPWKHGSDDFVVGVSLRREVPVPVTEKAVLEGVSNYGELP